MFSLKNPELVHKAYLKKIVLPEYPFLSFVKQIFIVHQNVFENHMIFCLLCLPFQFQSFNSIWTFLSPKKHCFKSIVLSLCLNVSFQIGDLQTIWLRVAPPPPLPQIQIHFWDIFQAGCQSAAKKQGCQSAANKKCQVIVAFLGLLLLKNFS